MGVGGIQKTQPGEFRQGGMDGGKRRLEFAAWRFRKAREQHTTATRGTRRELELAKCFLKPGAFHLQRVQTISGAKLMRRLGVLTEAELKRVDGQLALRLTI